ncbi:AAA family ATPase [Nocardia sp. NPDC047648]|uniref:AAA family ATPase n=1 Tax=Nocardia sp. NPDC047648 TaxID=3155625 RepID=UPI0034020513
MTNTEPLALVSAYVEKVLGEYDHSLTFPGDEGFVIIYGPNGVGKTKFLEILHAASQLKSRELVALPFESATLRYSDGTALRIVNEGFHPRDFEPERASERISQRLEYTLDVAGKRTERYTYTGEGLEEWIILNTSWRPFEGELWEDQTDGEVIPLNVLERRYANRASTQLPPSSRSKIPNAFMTFSSRIPSFLIETQRLRIEQQSTARDRRTVTEWDPYIPASRRKKPPSSKITQQATKMRSLINEAQTEHSKITQQLDRTFPNRVLESSPYSSVEDAEVRNRYNEQNGFRSRLGPVASVALEDALSLPDRQLLDWELQLLGLYLDDADKKLAPFETLLQKIELLESIINSRLLRKRIQVTASEGLKIIHDASGERIGLDSLSSGEQHEIILVFDLLFNVPRGALVLIDEPEISLHIVWQLAFIPDVQRIAELAGFRFVVATHSPQIINDMWERAVRLGPPEAAFA